MIADFNAPGIMKSGSRSNNYPAPYSTSKTPKQPPSEAIKGNGRKPEKGVLQKEPEKDDKFGSAIGEARIIPFL
jgi:hypothetical protein